MNKKYVIVRSNRLNSFGNDVDQSNVSVKNMFRDGNLFSVILKEVLLKLRLRIPDYLFNPELKDLDADTIIVFDGHARASFLEWLMKNNKGKRLIFWCWNTVDEIEHNFSLNNVPSEYEIWSYSEHDCQERGYSYNTTFYWKSYNLDMKSSNIDYDVYFVGKDKGRMKKLLDLKRGFTDEGLKSLIQIMPNHKWSMKRTYCRPVPYKEVIENIRRSKAIMDIKVNINAGPSLRALEAAFYRKKLITDDCNVRHFKFYSPNNVLIIGGGYNPTAIRGFLDKEYQEIEPESLQYYNVQNWLKRFG